MFRYACFGLTVDSELELPNLPPGDGDPDVAIRLGRVPHSPGATMDEEIVLHPLGGTFRIKEGREIVLDPPPGADPDLLRVLLTGRMMAFLLRQRGWLPLHASGVDIDGRAVLFLGAAGRGKSTIAAAFHRQGRRVVTDDVGAIRPVIGRRCVVCPGGSRIRLKDDSRSVLDGTELRRVFQWDKHTLDLAGVEPPDPLPVGRIYVLDYGTEIGNELIPPLTAAALLSTHSFVVRRRMNREALSAHIRDCALVAATVPVLRLVRLRSLAALPELVRQVEADVAAAV